MIAFLVKRPIETSMIYIALAVLGILAAKRFGKIYINQEDFAILKVEYRYKWHKRNLKKSKIDTLWVNHSGWLGSIYYKKAKEKYRLLNLGYTIEKETYYKDESFHFKKLDDYEVTIDFVSH